MGRSARHPRGSDLGLVQIRFGCEDGYVNPPLVVRAAQGRRPVDDQLPCPQGQRDLAREVIPAPRSDGVSSLGSASERGEQGDRLAQRGERRRGYGIVRRGEEFQPGLL